MLPMQRVWVRLLTGELKSLLTHSVAKKIPKLLKIMFSESFVKENQHPFIDVP